LRPRLSNVGVITTSLNCKKQARTFVPLSHQQIHRRWAMRQDARTAVLGVALEVDRDIHLQFRQQPRNLGVAFRSHVEKLTSTTPNCWRAR
jgi:hypothetical protein